MPIPGAPDNSSSSLADLLGGVNRPQLNAFVANSQARNGLVSAQTQEAMTKASQAQEQMEAWDNIKTALRSKGMKESDADLVRNITVGANNHDAETALKSLGLADIAIGGDQSNPNPGMVTQGQQIYQGRGAPPVTAPPNSIMPPNSSLAGQPVAQTGGEQAREANLNAQAGLHTLQETHPGLFHPNAGGGASLNPDILNYEGYKYYKSGKMPALGMGNAPLRAGIMGVAAQLAQREANGEDITNPAYETALTNGQDFLGAQKAVNSAAGGTLGNQSRAINNLVGHLKVMEDLVNDLNNGTFQPGNKVATAWQRTFGKPAPTNVQAAAEVIGPELAKSLSQNGGAGTGPERQEFSNTVGNLANAPEQSLQAIHTWKDMLGRQAADLAFQYHGATGRSDYARRYIQPDVAQYLGISAEGGPPATAAPAGGGGATPLSESVPTPAGGVPSAPSPAGGGSGAAAAQLPPQAAAQLKEGIHTTFGNSQIWTLHNGKPVRVQ